MPDPDEPFDEYRNFPAEMRDSLRLQTGEWIAFGAPDTLKKFEKIADPDLVLIACGDGPEKVFSTSEAVLSGAIDWRLNNWLVRRSALENALPEIERTDFGPLAPAALLAALAGKVLRIDSKTPGSAAPTGRKIFDAYAVFTRFAAALPHPGIDEVDFREMLDSFQYRYIRSVLLSTPDETLIPMLPKMAETLDSLQLEYAVWYFKPQLFRHFRLPFRPSSGRAVKKLGIFCAYLRHGGAERCASLQMEMYARAGLEITYFSLEEPTENDYPLPAGAVRIVLPKEPHEQQARLAVELEKRAVDTCIFFDNAERWSLRSILTARRAGCRTVAMQHNMFSYPWRMGDPAFAAERECVYAAADAVTVLSRTDLAMWRMRGFERSLYLPNLPTFQGSGKSAPESQTILFLGRLSPDKGADAAIEVLDLVRKTHPRAKLILAGRAYSESFQAVLHRRAAAYGLTDSIEFTGYTTDVPALFRRSAIFIMPSKAEGFPMSLMEAKSFGVPTVLYDLPYLEAARPEMGCVSVPRGNAPAMADAVARLFSDPAELERLGGEARASLRQFSYESVQHLWEQLFAAFESDRTDALFANVQTDAEKARFAQIALNELENSCFICLTHPEFTAKIGRQAIADYLRERPGLELADRCGRLCGKFSPFLWMQKIFPRKIWKKLYRKLWKASGNPGKNGFPFEG